MLRSNRCSILLSQRIHLRTLLWSGAPLRRSYPPKPFALPVGGQHVALTHCSGVHTLLTYGRKVRRGRPNGRASLDSDSAVGDAENKEQSQRTRNERASTPRTVGRRVVLRS